MSMNSALTGALAAGALLLSMASSAHAIPIADLFNTGVDNAGTPLGDLVDDPHYSIIGQPSGDTLSDQTIPEDDFPIPPWIANDANSRWIGPDQNADGDGPAGNYLYRTTFTLPANVDLTSVMITGRWAADNAGLNILINGVPTLQMVADFTAYAAFSISDNFMVGTNNLDFLIGNSPSPQGDNPTGLRVDDMTGEFDVTQVPGVPEPGTLALFGLGLAGLGLARQRKLRS